MPKFKCKLKSYIKQNQKKEWQIMKSLFGALLFVLTCYSTCVHSSLLKKKSKLLLVLLLLSWLASQFFSLIWWGITRWSFSNNSC